MVPERPGNGMSGDSADYFDAAAGRWEELRRGFFTEALRDRAFAAAGAEKGRTAADIGAGTGFMTEGLLGLTVAAVDRSEAMLDEMRRKFGASGRVTFHLAEASRLPLAAGSVDSVFANMLLHHLESPAEAVAEMVRILKPGGRLVITDLDEHAFTFLREEHRDCWMGFRREDVRRWLEGAALLNVVVEGSGQDCRADSACGRAARVGIFIASGEKRKAKPPSKTRRR